jgi:hypothetical protein
MSEWQLLGVAFRGESMGRYMVVLYPNCFYVGLLGGAVYISGYKRIFSGFAKAIMGIFLDRY